MYPASSTDHRTQLLHTLRALACCSLLVLASTAAVGQSLVLEGGTVHPVVGTPYVGHVVIEDDTIRAAGRDVAIPPGARRVDVRGLHVFPGFFDAFGQMGLVEISSVPATVDSSEMGTFNPHLEAATAIHPASEVIPVTRAEGLTQAVVAPRTGRDGVIAGQASVVKLDGWTVEEMTIKPRAAMVIVWPQIQTRSFDFATFSIRETPFSEAEEKAEEARNALRDWLDAGRHYARAVAARSDRLERDLELEALGPMLAGDQPVVIVANAKRDIESAIAFAEEEGLRMILAGGQEAWRLGERLAEQDIPVILGSVQSLPREEDHPYDQPYGRAGQLAAAGVTIAFGSGAGGGFGPGGPHSARTLIFEAGMATAYGLDPAVALAALTLNPARIFGVDDRLGSIEAGKIANLVVTDGDALDIRTKVHHVLIAGRSIDLDNKHRALYDRHRSRPAP